MITPRNLRQLRLALAAILMIVWVPIAQAAETSAVESMLTQETVGFLHVRVADVWDSPSFAFYRKMLGNLGAEEIKAFNGKFAPSPAQFESVTVIMPSTNIRGPIPEGRPVGESMLWVITTKQPVDRVDLIKGLGLETRTKAHRGSDYFFDEAHWAGIMLIEPTTLVVGSEDSIVRLIEQREKARGAQSPLANVFAREASKHAAILGVNPAALATPEIIKNVPEPITPLLKATSAWAALDLKQENRLALNVEFATAEQAAAGAQAVEAVRKMAYDLIAVGIKEMQNDEAQATKRPVMGLLDMPSLFGPTVGKAALKYLEASLKGLVIENKESTLRTSLNLSEFFPANADFLTVVAFAGFTAMGRSYGYSSHGYDGDREEIPYYIRDQFSRVSAALEAYHQDKGSFPPAAICDKNGKALLSWRVLILPYLEQRQGDLPMEGNGLFGAKPAAVEINNPGAPNPNKRTFEDIFKQFKLDEPWDSLNNKKLIERMPRPFKVDFTANSWQMQNDWKTGLQVFTGPGTLFPGQNAVSKGQVRDGVEATIAVVFRDDPTAAVIWTKPADIPFAADKRLPRLFNVPPNYRGYGDRKDPKSPGVFVILADGQSRRLPPDFDEKDFKGLVTIAGGEKVKVPEPRNPKDGFKDSVKPFEK
jgi:hypothetical protein